MVRAICFLILAFSSSVCGVGAAHAEHRVALVIGNSAYPGKARLANPANDAEDIGNRLQELGFDVYQGTDLTIAGFDRILRSFRDALKTADVALLFYAGHGASINGVNYLIPVDAKFGDGAKFTAQAISLKDIQALMEYRPRTNLLFFDACRNNPFLQNLTKSFGGEKSPVRPGWANIAPAHGTYISFASAEGEVASDGSDKRNSPFTSALLEHIGEPNKDVQLMMRDVRKHVIDETNGAQVPWEKGSLVSKFVFAQRAESPEEEPLIIQSNKKVYAKGEKLKLSVTARQNCRLTLLNVDDKGKSCLLFPNKYLADETLKAGKTFVFPPKGSMRVEEAGEETFIAMCNASPEAKAAAQRTATQINCSKGPSDRRFNDNVLETVVLDFSEEEETEDQSASTKSAPTVLKSSITISVTP